MVQVSYPGVYVQEIPSGSRTITGVSTSIAMFIGATERGPLNVPTRLFSYSDYTRAFGGVTPVGELATAVRLFFNNGGTQAYVTRIADGALSAEVTLKNSAGVNVLKLVAREAGVRGGDIRVTIDYNTTNPSDTFNLRAFRLDQATQQETDVEVHSNLSMLSTATRFVENVIAQNSKLLTAEKLGDSVVDGYVIGARVIDGATLADALATVLTGTEDWKIRVLKDGAPATVMVKADNFVDNLSDSDITATGLAVAGGKFLVKLTPDGDAPFTSLRVIQSGDVNDVASALQFGPALGGIEALQNADRRPVPSGVVLRVLGDTGLVNIAAKTLATVDINVAGIDFLDLDVQVGADEWYKVGTDLSLANLKAKLGALAGAFNVKAAATPNFPWRLEVQGYDLVLRALTGSASTGVTTSVVSADLIAVGNYEKLGNARQYSFSGGEGYQLPGTTGNDGSFPISDNYDAAYEIIRRDVDLFNLLILPRSLAMPDSDRLDLWGPASTFCLERRAFLLIDPPATWKTVADITGPAPNINTLRQGIVKDHAAVYFPRLTVKEDGINRFVDPSGAVAGIYARIDASRGVFKAPAGIEADVRAVNNVERQVSDIENGVTNPLAVNTVRVFPNGIVVWGARTMAGFDNGDDDHKYVPVVRLTLFIAESLARGLKFAVFEPNDEPLWAQLRLAAGGFMNNLFRQGAFQGQKRSDAYFVKVDNETTTQNDINLGIVNVVIGFAPLKPAEFVVVTIQQIAGQVQI